MQNSQLQPTSSENRSHLGLETQKAKINFAGDLPPEHRELLQQIILIKEVAATVNKSCGFLETEKADAIIQACQSIDWQKDGFLFPLPALQGGAGTSTHTNVNEVIASKANLILTGKNHPTEPVHPNDQVNLFQSTNDVYPSALKIAAIHLLLELTDELATVQTAFQQKEKEFSEILKPGRTQLQEALPITLGQEFSAYAEAFARDRWRISKAEERLRQLNLGGTAVGTGIGAPKIFIFKLIEELRRRTGLGIGRADNPIEMTQNCDLFVEVSGILKTVAVNLLKISSDLRLLASGPAAGLGEIILEKRQAGSTIMPGKVNPVIPEFVGSLAIQVMACDQAITTAASLGQLELNAFMPVIAFNLLSSIKMLLAGTRQFRTLCVDTLQADETRCKSNLLKSASLATLLTPYLGYEKVADLVKYCKQENCSVAEGSVALGYFSEEELGHIFKARKATAPGIAGSDMLKDRLAHLSVKPQGDSDE